MILTNMKSAVNQRDLDIRKSSRESVSFNCTWCYPILELLLKCHRDRFQAGSSGMKLLENQKEARRI